MIYLLQNQSVGDDIMKKILCLLVAILTLSTVSCNSNSSKDSSAGEKITGVEYMQSVKEKITEKQPEDIVDKRDGIDYPEFRKYTYFSKTAGRDTNVNVLLPPNYSEDKKYPVLYLLHGYFGNEDWAKGFDLSLDKMISNLYADGQAEEMIVVAPYMFCSKDMPSCTGMDLENSLAYDNFINDLTTDLMPFIEKTFSVKTGRKNTAITGFSMGGRESLFIGASLPELFGYIGAVCPAPGLVEIPNSPMHPGQLEKSELTFTKKAPYLLLVSAAVNDPVVTTAPESYHNLLTDNGVMHLWHTVSDGGHDASSVKPHLYNFLRMVFKV